MNLDLFLSLPVKPKNTCKIRCLIYSKNDESHIRCSLIFDTGASTTSLTRSVTNALNYTEIQKGRVPKTTANGLITFDTVEISRIVVGGEFAFNNMVTDILKWKNSSIQGVIGMDIISKLHFYSDTNNLVIQNKPFKNIVQEFGESKMFL